LGLLGGYLPQPVRAIADSTGEGTELGAPFLEFLVLAVWVVVWG